MARSTLFSGLSEFLAVAGHGSFRAAAAELGVSPAAVSQTIKALEARLGAQLFVRTTRRVALTEAGSALHERLRPAAEAIGEAVVEVGASRGRPAGQLKLTVPRIAVDLVIAPVLPGFRRAFPEISVEIDVNDASIDLVSNGFDAGIRIGRFIEKDMVGVRLTTDFRWCVVGSPAYLEQHGAPRSPEELAQHRCIAYRYPTAKSVYRWQFNRRGKAVSVDVINGLVVNDHLTMVALARGGAGLAYTADRVVAQDLAEGRLRQVLEAFTPVTRGLYLYFPARSQRQPKLRAFLDFAKEALR